MECLGKSIWSAIESYLIKSPIFINKITNLLHIFTVKKKLKRSVCFVYRTSFDQLDGHSRGILEMDFEIIFEAKCFSSFYSITLWHIREWSSCSTISTTTTLLHSAILDEIKEPYWVTTNAMAGRTNWTDPIHYLLPINIKVTTLV